MGGKVSIIDAITSLDIKRVRAGMKQRLNVRKWIQKLTLSLLVAQRKTSSYQIIQESFHILLEPMISTQKAIGFGLMGGPGDSLTGRLGSLMITRMETLERTVHSGGGHRTPTTGMIFHVTKLVTPRSTSSVPTQKSQGMEDPVTGHSVRDPVLRDRETVIETQTVVGIWCVVIITVDSSTVKL